MELDGGSVSDSIVMLITDTADECGLPQRLCDNAQTVSLAINLSASSVAFQSRRVFTLRLEQRARRERLRTS